MSDKIYFRRGLRADIPLLASGEPGYCTDTKELFIGNGSSNEKIHAPFNKTSSFRAYNSATQTFTLATYTKAIFNTKEYDNLNEYDSVTNNRMTVTESGIYLIQASITTLTAAANSVTTISIYLNGVRRTDFDNQTTGASGGATFQGTTFLNLVAGNYIEIYVNPSAAFTSIVSTGLTFFQVVRVA